MYTKILVPLDGTSASELVLPHVRALATAFRAEVILISVAAHPVMANYVADAVRWQLKNRDDVAEAYLDRIARDWREAGLTVTTGVYEGDVTDLILKQAADRQVDLIAMATHGVSGVEGILLSGVAGRVFHYASVPVLLVKSHVTGETHHAEGG